MSSASVAAWMQSWIRSFRPVMDFWDPPSVDRGWFSIGSEWAGELVLECGFSCLRRNGLPTNIRTRQYSSFRCIAERICWGCWDRTVTTSFGRESHQFVRALFVVSKRETILDISCFWQFRRRLLLFVRPEVPTKRGRSISHISWKVSSRK